MNTTQVQHHAVTDFVHNFVAASLNRQMHAPDSTFVLDSLQTVIESLRHCQDHVIEMPINLQLDDLMIHCDCEPLNGPSLQAGSLLRHCKHR